MQLQHQAATDPFLQHAIGLSPVPEAAHFLRQGPPVERGMVGDQLPQEGHIGLGHFSPAVGQQHVHARQDTGSEK